MVSAFGRMFPPMIGTALVVFLRLLIQRTTSTVAGYLAATSPTKVQRAVSF